MPNWRNKIVRIFIVLCLSIFSATMGISILIPILPLYAKDLGASGIMLGIIFSSFSLTMSISNPIIGRLSDLWGYKRIISLGLLLHVPVALFFVLATNTHHLIIIRLLEGILCAMVDTAAIAYVGAIAPKDKEGSYMGIFNTSLFLGIGIGPFLGGFLTDKYNSHMPFYFMAAFLAISFIVVLFLLPGKDLKANLDETRDNKKKESLLKKALRSDLMKGLLIFAFVIALGNSGLLVFLPVLAQREHITPTQIGVLVSLGMFCIGILQTPFGYVANKYNKVFLIITGFLIISIILVIVPSCSTFWIFLIMNIIGGIGAAMASPAATALVARGANDLGIGMGLAMGLFNFAFGGGMIVGPVLCGIIKDIIGLDQTFYMTSALFVLATIVIYLFTKDLENI